MGQTVKSFKIGNIEIPVGGGGSINPVDTTEMVVTYDDGTTENYYLLDESNGSASGGVDLDTYNDKVDELEAKDTALQTEINQLKNASGQVYKLFDPDTDIIDIISLSFGAYLASFSGDYSSVDIRTPYFVNGDAIVMNVPSGNTFTYTRGNSGCEYLKGPGCTIIWHTDDNGDTILDSYESSAGSKSSGMIAIDLTDIKQNGYSAEYALAELGESGMYAVGGEESPEGLPNGSKIFINNFTYMDTKSVYYTVVRSEGCIDTYYYSGYYENGITGTDITKLNSGVQTLEVSSELEVDKLPAGRYIVSVDRNLMYGTLYAPAGYSESGSGEAVEWQLVTGTYIEVDYYYTGEYWRKTVTLNSGNGKLYKIYMDFDSAGDPYDTIVDSITIPVN